MEAVNMVVITIPTDVGFHCPHCDRDVAIEFYDLWGEIGDVCDWQYFTINCPECEKELKIGEIDWD